MTSIRRSALVRYSAQQMFDLVNDVAAYSYRFAWCEGAAVLADAPGERVARLALRMGGLRARFTTRNALQPPERIAMELVEGPFTRLNGAWQFTPLDDMACKVELALDFEAAGRLAGSALVLAFQGLTDRLVDDFCKAARRVYG